VRLLGALRPPQPAIPAALPAGAEGESRADNLAWRLVAQLSLNFLSLAKEGRGVDPLHALLDLYADRGDPSLARNVHSITRIDSRPVIERLQIDGPMCFGRG
ncbi:type VI secretion system baseplate subunit TssF, partial [Mesorhizobium sp.]